MHTTTLLLVLSLTSTFLFYVFRTPKLRRNGEPLRRPPNTLPLVGNGILFLQDRHKLFSWFVKCEKLFGSETFQISVPSLPPGVVINDPKNLEYVFKNEGIFTKGDFFKRRSWDLFGNGIINADGDLWKVQRKAGLNFLSNTNLKVLTDVALPQYLDDTIQDLQKKDPESVFDLEEVLHELTTQIMGQMAYNLDIHNSDPFSKSFDYASGATGKRFQNPLWQITEIFFGEEFRDSVARVKAFGSMLVANAVEARKTENVVEKKTSFGQMSGSLINSLLDTIDDHQMVADAALNYLSAGRDTTAQALTWTFYLLMRNPDKTQAARLEVSDYVGPSSGRFDTSKLHPTALPYIAAIFYEALRLFPPVPFELKQCGKAVTLPDGTFLPKDAVLLWCTWAMNRSKAIWGDDADDFKPERWLENGSLISKTAFEYPVFNGGPRTCLGKKMAELVAVQVIATLVLKFDFNPIDGKERVSKNSLTLPMEGGLPCRVKSRC
ncbi:cytochrome P450 [Mollisia scopiformis]|uniref:Cytochrome P450 n=1 Tax=Mollisia scopiformis TaxID=149040 RepID=A0A194WX79_MOLSC|nr:cytochrome P450 [Mollisia scopiformis]KUJ12289.1 cytochrome P450 [Mollisia scopiformis]